MQTAFAPIETRYKGYRFRSRLEARWAVFFDALRLRWEYEKEGYLLGDLGPYLPDFWLPWPSDQWPNAGHWIEVKGEYPDHDALAKVVALAETTNHTSFLVWGLPGENIIFAARRDGKTNWMDYPPTLPGSPFEAGGPFALYVLMSRWNVGDVHPACDAARAARFEYGETP